MKELKPVDQQFADGKYPLGEICEYRINADDRTAVNRFTSEEKKVVYKLQSVFSAFAALHCSFFIFLFA